MKQHLVSFHLDDPVCSVAAEGDEAQSDDGGHEQDEPGNGFDEPMMSNASCITRVAHFNGSVDWRGRERVGLPWVSI